MIKQIPENEPEPGHWNHVIWPFRYQWDNFVIRVKESIVEWNQHRQFAREQQSQKFNLRDGIRARFYAALFFVLNIDFSVIQNGHENEVIRYEISQRKDRLLARFKGRLSFTERVKDFLFYLLDCDTTNSESGANDDRISHAILIWFQRVFLSRWIEIVGVFVLVAVGAVCYYLILP